MVSFEHYGMPCSGSSFLRAYYFVVFLLATPGLGVLLSFFLGPLLFHFPDP